MTNSITILRSPEVQRRLGISRSTLYRLFTPGASGFDPLFPRPIRILANSVGWLDSEISDFIEQRVRASRPAVAANG